MTYNKLITQDAEMTEKAKDIILIFRNFCRINKCQMINGKTSSSTTPLFLGEKERNLVKQINDEVIERVVGQQVIYFPIDIEHTNYHPAMAKQLKTFLPPVRVYARVDMVELKLIHGWNFD